MGGMNMKKEGGKIERKQTLGVEPLNKVSFA